ncbi:MAG: glycosyltransferase family 61 protein [Sporocytophaga sp.]|nr:glycosyltransferase family 61 protein [Sporocytophaga sp.]
MNLKNLIKQFVPASVRKKAYLLYNTIKIKSIDKLLFPELKIDKKDFKLYQELHPFRINKVQIKEIKDKEVHTYMDRWYEWTQEEFILEFNDCLIEPDIGWAFTKNHKINYYSLGISRTLFLPKPSFFKLLWKKDIKSKGKVISLRDSGEENYFHFYNDVLAKLFFLEHHGIELSNYNILVSEKLWNKSYFQYYFNRSPFLQGLKWLIQKNEFIYAETCIFCKPLTHRKELFDEILSLLPLSKATGERKVYLKRSKQRLRYIENDNEIETVVRSYGFEIIDADELPVEEQIVVFSQTRYLIAVHGAGITNIIYRKDSPMNVLELFPPPVEGYLPFHYIMLSQMYSFKYQALIGQESSIAFSSGFYLNSDKLNKEIANLLMGKNEQ